MAKIPRLKGDARYRDAPRFKLIYEYEGIMKKDYSKLVKNMTITLGLKMKNLLKIN